MDSKRQFSLAFLLWQVFLVAALLGLIRLWPPPDPSWVSGQYEPVNLHRIMYARCLIGLLAVGAGGVLIGNFFRKPILFGAVALATAAPVCWFLARVEIAVIETGRELFLMGW
jgi:hypothetical protein